MTTRSVRDLIRTGETPVTRVKVLTGESSDPARRGDKKLVAFSDCRYFCPNRAVLDAVIDALVASDERLRSRPEEQMLWDWDNTWLELTDETDPDAGATIILGVAWYDRAFFDDRKVAWFGAMHQRIYQQIGVPLEQVEVSHFLAAQFATWTPEPEPAPQTTDALTGATA
jgi:hypothetical protein